MKRRGVLRWLALFAGEASTFVLLAVFILAARTFGPAEYGSFAFLFTAANLLAELLAFGFAAAIQREVARDGAEARFMLWAAIRIQIPLAVVAIGAVNLIAAWFAPEPGLWLPATLLAVAAVIRSVKGYLRHAWRGLKRFGTEAASLWFERCLLLAAAGLVFFGDGRLLALATVFLATRLIDVVISFAITRPLISAPPREDRNLSKVRLLIRVAPLALTVIFSTIYYQVDILMLGALSDATQVGIYHAVYRFVDVVLAGARVLIMVFVPVLSLYFISDRAGFRNASSRVFAFGVSFGMLVILAGPAAAAYLVAIFLGDAYAGGATPLAFLLAASGISALSFALQTILVASDEEKRVAIALGVTATANIVTNAILIPEYGALGAAWATLLSEILLLAGLTAFALRIGGGLSWARRAAPIAAAAAIAAVLMWQLPTAALAWLGAYLLFLAATQIPNLRHLLHLVGR